ncbi:MAG: DUF4388 domain-containing protein [Pyrinomonadaceae bacterium]
MENIERAQFVVLTGHLDDQSLPDLIRMLRVQRKSGRLQVEYPDAPGSFFFEEGHIIDAQLGGLRGVEALYAAISLHGGASFNFNPLVRPPERSIDRQEQKFISDLIEVPQRENPAEIEVASDAAAVPTALPRLPHNASLQLAPVPAELITPLEARLTAVEAAISSTSRRFSRERLVYAVIISFLIGLTLITALQAIFGSFLATSPASATEAARSNSPPAAAAAAAAAATPVLKELEGVAPALEREGIPSAAQQGSGLTKQATPATKQARQSFEPTVTADAARRTGGNSSARGGEFVVSVLMDVKNGRVTKARVLNSRPGARSAESRALKTARERRYPDNFTGSERVQIRVKP